MPPQRVFTCRSFDIVAHEAGHAILDGLKPSWIFSSSTPQTGAMHEAFGDLTAIFLALSQFDQVEAVIAQTRSDLHDKTFLSDVAEEFGLALGRPNGLRNADNDLRLSQTGTQVHALSQVFTGGIFDVMADVFAFERKPAKTQYRNFIRNRFTIREVVVSPTPLTANFTGKAALAPVEHESCEKTPQNRVGCCGTMLHSDFNGDSESLEADIEEFRKSLQAMGQGGGRNKGTAVSAAKESKEKVAP
jgi:hypothetical protein